MVFFEEYCQYSDFLTLESRTEIGVGVLFHVTSLVPALEDAELTERTKVGFEPKGWLSFNVDSASGSGVRWLGGAGVPVRVMPTAAMPALKKLMYQYHLSIFEMIIPSAAIDEDSIGN